MTNLVVNAGKSVKDDKVNYIKRKNLTAKVGDERAREVREGKGSENFILKNVDRSIP